MNPVFKTSEGLEYEVEFTVGTVSSKFHGPGWEKLVRDYDPCFRDVIKIHLESDDLNIDIEMRLTESRGGQKPIPNPLLVSQNCLSNSIYEVAY